MKTPLNAILLALTLTTTATVMAESKPILFDQLQYDTVHEVAERSILAIDSEQRPMVAVLRLSDGDFLPPHGAGGGLRLLTVLSGNLSWGEGTKVDPAMERVYPAGTILEVPAEGGEHWAAARDGDVMLQVVFVRNGALAPGATGE
ncbi:hypothetical protein [Parahaliea mediterranea]|uniref:hypothetical protein n=1 Tax=Parahaliea mediterranea TaxID=651086 RepID=UPI0013007ADA|nr:hypothetical protein [Parahaliea mediterranea]